MRDRARRERTLIPQVYTRVGAKGTEGAVVDGPTRRDFLRLTMFGALGATLLGGLGAFVAYFYPKQAVAASIVKVPDDIATVASLKGNPDVYQVRAGKFYLSVFNADDAQPDTHPPVAGQGKLAVMALSWKCKHLGCAVPWKPDEDYGDYHGGVFHCPCHESIYTRTGQNVSGPAPMPLDYMPITFEGNRLVVNTGKIITRTQYNPTQVTLLP